jgi:tetratricopeptide (TPR) repeat protein
MVRPVPGLVVAFLTCALPLACGQDADGLPRLADAQGVDELVRARIETALAAAERGESGARLELAKVYDANGLAELALPLYEQCLAGAAAEARATLEFLRGQALAQLGRPAEALAAFDAALAAGDAYAPTHWRRGELLLEFGRLPEARAAFEAALAIEPRSVPASLGRARVALLDDDPAGALALLEPLAARAPDERFVHGLLARALRALGREAEAARELAREQRSARVSLSDPRTAEVQTRATGALALLRQADDVLLAGDPAAALALLAPLEGRAPADLAVVQMLAKVLLEAREYERALAVLEAGMKTHPDQFKLELSAGLAWEGKKALKRAREHLLRACALNPAFGPAHAALGEVETKLSLFPEAEASLTRALESGDDDLRTRILLVQVQLEQGALERALAGARATCAEFPNSAAAWSYLAEAHARAGAHEEARRALAEAEQRNPEYERLARVRALLEPSGVPAGTPR